MKRFTCPSRNIARHIAHDEKKLLIRSLRCDLWAIDGMNRIPVNAFEFKCSVETVVFLPEIFKIAFGRVFWNRIGNGSATPQAQDGQNENILADKSSRLKPPVDQPAQVINADLHTTRFGIAIELSPILYLDRPSVRKMMRPDEIVFHT